MSGQGVSFEGSIEIKKLISYLEDIVSGFKVGKICVQEEEKFVTISPGDVVDLKVEVEQKKDVEKFSLKTTWSRKDKKEQPVQLKISSHEPAIKIEKKHHEDELDEDKKDKNKDKKKK